MANNVLAIVPARGGSKGIKRKNLALCAGKPLLQWTIEAAKEARLVDQAIVSSEDTEILSFAYNHGADTIIRPKKYATDDASTESVIEHTLQSYPEHKTIVLLQPTSPIRTGQQIDEAIDVFRRGGYDTLLSVVRSHAFLWHTSNSLATYDAWHRPQRQGLEDLTEENGSIYIFTMEWWRTNKNRLGGEIGFYIMPEECRYQIDTPFDLWLCEKILEEHYDRS